VFHQSVQKRFVAPFFFKILKDRQLEVHAIRYKIKVFTVIDVGKLQKASDGQTDNVDRQN